VLAREAGFFAGSLVGIIVVLTDGQVTSRGGEVIFMPPVCFVWRITNAIYRAA
jgi:hypothetical protein